MLTFQFAWRKRLAQDGVLLGARTRIVVDSVQAFYAKRASACGTRVAKTGAVTVVQRMSSDMWLNPHLHIVFLDGAYHEEGNALSWEPLGPLTAREVGEVLERAAQRILKHLRRRDALACADEDAAEGGEPESRLAAFAVSGHAAPAEPCYRSPESARIR